jgi:hypothetical protein
MVEYRYFSLGDRKLIKPEIFEESTNGVLILYDGFYHKPIKRYKLIKKLNKCTAGNTWLSSCGFYPARNPTIKRWRAF